MSIFQSHSSATYVLFEKKTLKDRTEILDLTLESLLVSGGNFPKGCVGGGGVGGRLSHGKEKYSMVRSLKGRYHLGCNVLEA